MWIARPLLEPQWKFEIQVWAIDSPKPCWCLLYRMLHPSDNVSKLLLYLFINNLQQVSYSTATFYTVLLLRTQRVKMQKNTISFLFSFICIFFYCSIFLTILTRTNDVYNKCFCESKNPVWQVSWQISLTNNWLKLLWTT